METKSKSGVVFKTVLFTLYHIINILLSVALFIHIRVYIPAYPVDPTVESLHITGLTLRLHTLTELHTRE